MTGLIVTDLLLLVFLAGTMLRYSQLLDRQNKDAARERQKLLDRIQHPERVLVEPGDREIHDPPKDAAELAAVGTIVPEFVEVGGED
jgi:hypothetical protein